MAKTTTTTEYPFSFEEIAALVTSFGGDVAQLRDLQDLSPDGPWRARSIGGYASDFCHDVRLAPLNERFSVVYWGGRNLQDIGVWSFQISRYCPTATCYNERRDTPVCLAEERIQVFVDTPRGRVALQDGKLVALEGSHVHVVYSPRSGPEQTTTFKLPTRERAPDPNVVLLP
ncbi:hypothetical protein B0H13DRAFT_1971109 [Mycena leptocephala]|nr:hypothetical protein B0H13DRAFT_1971109 [Mycena leptocephala]